ncbi:amidohydrolase family protein [Cryptosporangium aurantiacum]|uniref:Predicted metal-dependent hydrolase, TIM-barrel fold n=1 Tax=Cryptosporangium aurantiacum TaxID=134849 RepID=A0A1M7KMU3_9ACTN|nr:amidohydrolase family protein [Cryptosporangium aurantiacum]SHM66699.1 Predicted metal-dependent hydrolase, TIM-barrel fold [Cryptosporangium aurantiacum]
MPLPDDAKIISVDDHVIEHPRVWLDRMPQKYQDVAPRIERLPDGNDTWIFNGKPSGNFALNAVAGKHPREFGMDPRSYDDMRPGCHDIGERIKDMDVEGVWAQLCFPNMGGFAGSTFYACEDKDLAAECIRAYNDFILDEWCAYAPDRQIPLVMVPFWDVQAAVKEVERTAAKGAKSVSFIEAPHRVGLPSYHTDHWDPLLRICEEANLPVSVHFGSGGAPQGVAQDADMFVTIALFGINSMMACVDLLISPVFYKFPNIKFVLSEGGIGWIPYILERADYSWGRHKYWCNIDQDRKPSELFKDHIYGAFISDQNGIDLRHSIGVEQILFESDYPHSDCNWPHTRKVLGEQLAGVPDDEARLIVEGNARRIFNFPA